MKKILLLSLTLISFILFTSCNEYENNYGLDNTVYLPVKIQYSESTITFQYDSQNRLIEYKDLDGSYSEVITFVYSNDELVSAKEVVTEIQTMPDGTEKTYSYTTDYTFTYMASQVTVTEYYTSSNGFENTGTSLYTIDSNGNLQTGNGLVVTYDSKGNITKLVGDGITYTYNYDDKIGMFKNVKTPLWVFALILDEMHTFKVNNITKIEIDDIDEDESESEISNITYQYNSENYPIKMYIEDSDDFSDSATIQYLKK